MVVMILEKVNPRLRGTLSRWLIEPHSGVFVGHVNGMVRDRLWEKCCRECHEGGIIQMWTMNNEQRFEMRMFGFTNRRVMNYEGLQLIEIPLKEKARKPREGEDRTA